MMEHNKRAFAKHDKLAIAMHDKRVIVKHDKLERACNECSA